MTTRKARARISLIALAVVTTVAGCQAGPAAAGPVLPEFSAGDFAAGAPVDNPFHPLVPGTVRRYEADVLDLDGGETTREVDVVTVTSQTKTIAGVAARVVRDRAFEDGVLVEDTFDYYAQDKQGNVWYLGEDTRAFEYDDDGNVVSASTRGSWHAGVSGAKPGFIMPAARTVGFSYYQEFAQQDQALDQAKIVSLDESVSTPAGDFTGVLKTEETTQVEPGVLENKFYARGVGEVMVFEEVNASGEPLNRITLVSVTTAAAVPLPTGARSALAATGLLLMARRSVSWIGRRRVVCHP